MFHTPKRTLQRPTKKGHKTNQQDEDIKGVGVIRGEVTPESRSTNDDPSLMRANAATRHERSRRSGPNAEPERESSEHPGSQVQVVMDPGDAVPADDSEDILTQLQNPVSEDQLGCIDNAALLRRRPAVRIPPSSTAPKNHMPKETIKD